MRKTGLACTILVLALAGCESRLNPVNWFGNSTEATLPASAATQPTAVPQDPRPSVDQVSALTVDRVRGGAMITARAIPATQGWTSAALSPERRDIEGAPVAEGGTMAFRFVAVPPPGPQPVGSERSREVSAGVFVSNQQLQGVQTILVRGARNQRSARR